MLNYNKFALNLTSAQKIINDSSALITYMIWLDMEYKHNIQMCPNFLVNLAWLRIQSCSLDLKRSVSGSQNIKNLFS